MSNAHEWDVIVVGAGIIGCAVGWELARRGRRTAVIESRGVAAGATQASAGILAPYIEAPAGGPLHDLTVRSLAMYDRFIADLEQETGQQIEYRVCGTLEVAGSPQAESRLMTLAASARAEGMEARWLDGAETHAVEPQLAAPTGALLVTGHAYVGAAQLTQTLIEAAGRRGADVLRERVQTITTDGDGVDVKTTAATRRAANVVIAAGSWSQALMPDAPPVRPVRGQLIRLVWKSALLKHILWGDRCYIVPWTRGTVLVGATVEDVGFDERATVGGVRDLLDAAVELTPQARNASFVEARVGLRPATPDGLPVIGRSQEHPAIVYATGHYRNGVLLTPLTAVLVADLITAGRIDPALEAISPSRFSANSQSLS